MPDAVGRHLLPGVPLLPQQRGPRVALRGVRDDLRPVDMPHLRPHRLRALPRRPRQQPLEGDGPLLRPGAGDAAGKLCFLIVLLIICANNHWKERKPLLRPRARDAAS